MPEFEATREILSERLRERARSDRAKALEPGEFPEKWLTRAEEADVCAGIVANFEPAKGARK